ncbi:hypothetical protein NG895_01490 [Aeoliella sp. ICT_H6.2]|uniref:Uncharacterized protein n=1 Tax=Aeoliella straminimaris TaxID=2954799 RepID=A0A9X2F5K3_9BACT|nr:hypothetical protein [Aeoliella straminimaris]MCO6042570.1 hypothetical protein [Aeoliella straminimaris]
MSDRYTLVSGRPYVHQKCGTTTVINEGHFATLCNPFNVCLGTICANCGPGSLKDFHWEDTGESISDYRKRLRCEAPLWAVWYWLFAPILGAAIGAAVMVNFKAPNMTVTSAAITGAGIGVFLMIFLVGPMITGPIVGSRFYGQR